MSELERLENRFKELIAKPVKSKEEVDEVYNLGKYLETLYAKETKDLLIELADNGISISSVWDLVNTRKSYPKAIDILLKHLPKKYHDKNKEGIIRALAVKEAIGKASPVLIEEYNRLDKNKETLRWAIGNTIFSTVTASDLKDILKIVRNKENGMSRQMFIAALGKVKSEEAEAVLIDLLEDEQVAAIALETLNKMSPH